MGCHSACYGKKITLIAVVGFLPSYLGREILISRKVSVNRGITSISHQGGSPYYRKRIIRGRWRSWVNFWLVGKRVEREHRFDRFSSSENQPALLYLFRPSQSMILGFIGIKKE